MKVRRWRALVRHINTLAAELTCLGPIAMVRYAPAPSETMTERGTNQLPEVDGRQALISEIRPAMAGAGR